ncbi:hypothetical protein [Parafrankia discariae]|uniref:hypothetical protein n=1 Tax=Parafrankia discariae TaxID=365528 RepID=UPI0003639C6B|nr:hypothetical protein [Parafrankia discariae]
MDAGVPDDGVEVTPWEAPDPQGVPALRARQAHQMRQPQAIAQVAQVLAIGKGTLVPPSRGPAEAAQILCADEYRRLADAELFYVAGDMVRLAIAAGESLPDFRLEPEDVPAPAGFLVFAEPIGSYVNSDTDPPVRIPVVAISWGQFGAEEWPRGGVWVTYYVPSNYAGMEALAQRLNGRPLRQRERDDLRASRAPLVWDNESFLGFGAERDVERTPGDSHGGMGSTSLAPWAQTLRATWLLMNQGHIVEVDTLQPDRAAARRARRDGLPPSPVRLIHLRRATRDQGAPVDAGEAREYTCRWMVRGHWRQQWYPARGVHRPIWINPHLKGPDDKPLRTGETVRIWDR